MNPFLANSNIRDVAGNVRHELYVLSALLLSLEICSDSKFENCAEEAASLIAAARERLGQLLIHADDTAKGRSWRARAEGGEA
ncbi:hypothetical protein [Pelagibacterium sediminicola]|uniref:hypothetical protein n=1 Tax=Pelagibacterium sediminicola TaxID=2248761 RepID=UPI000E310D66|nr:hypothetical protein [Pelagibacterium sediminicola]